MKFLFRPQIAVGLVACLLLVGCRSGSDSSGGVTLDECGLSVNPDNVVICSFVASPTSSEAIVLKNYTSSNVVLNGWSLWDLNAYTNGSGQKSLGTESVVEAGKTLTISSLPFGINDSSEAIYLKNSSNAVVSTKGN